jgi:hypothetical protein
MAIAFTGQVVVGTTRLVISQARAADRPRVPRLAFPMRGRGLPPPEIQQAWPTDSRGGVMPTGDVETYYASNLWHNRVEGTEVVFGTDPTRGAAVWAGRARARADATTHVVRGLDGQVQQRHSYGEGAPLRGAADRLVAARSVILAGF